MLALPGLLPLTQLDIVDVLTLGECNWTVEWAALAIRIGAVTLFFDAWPVARVLDRSVAYSRNGAVVRLALQVG